MEKQVAFVAAECEACEGGEEDVDIEVAALDEEKETVAKEDVEAKMEGDDLKEETVGVVDENQMAAVVEYLLAAVGHMP